MNVVYVHAEALYVDDVDAALAHGEVREAVDDAQAENTVGTVDARGVVQVADAQGWTVAPAEHKRVQMKQPLEEGRVLIEEHFPESLEFLAQMELRQTVGFPGPLEPAQGTASGPALPAFLAAANPEVQPHSRQSYDL